VEGLEPPNPFGRLISNQMDYQLSYTSKIGGGPGTRTPKPLRALVFKTNGLPIILVLHKLEPTARIELANLILTKDALFQLSYVGIYNVKEPMLYSYFAGVKGLEPLFTPNYS
jgi:hypothetical protein